jgi:hypothetical protein
MISAFRSQASMTCGYGFQSRASFFAARAASTPSGEIERDQANIQGHAGKRFA